MKKHYTDIFLDLDRTLWDFESNSLETFKDLFNKYNLNQYYRTFDDFHSIYTQHNRKLWSLYRNGEITKDDLMWKRFYLSLKAVNVNDKPLAQKLSTDYLNISPTKKRLFPHTHESLTHLSQYYNLHIITNGFKTVQENKIKNCNLNQYFKHIFTSESIGSTKPNRRFFNSVLQESNAKIQNSLVIGDDFDIDIIGAYNVGIDSIWFNPTDKAIDTKSETKPIHNIRSLKELIELL